MNAIDGITLIIPQGGGKANVTDGIALIMPQEYPQIKGEKVASDVIGCPHGAILMFMRIYHHIQIVTHTIVD